jgi:hypothetical protein
MSAQPSGASIGSRLARTSRRRAERRDRGAQELRHVNCSCFVVAARVRIGAVIVNSVLITQGPHDSGVARAHLPAIKSENDFAIVEIADLRVKAALDRDLQIAAHLLELEEVVP